MAIRELTDTEIDMVSGGSWEDVGTILGGVAAVAGGVGYTVKTGGIGGFFGGGLAVTGGFAAISTGFSNLHDEWYGESS